MANGESTWPRSWNTRDFRPAGGFERAWRNAFISGETAEQAADRAEVEARNAPTSFERQKRR